MSHDAHKSTDASNNNGKSASQQTRDGGGHRAKVSGIGAWFVAMVTVLDTVHPLRAK